MTVTSTTTRAYDADTTTCDDCRTDLEADEARDCGSHTLCRTCIHDSPCRGCRDLAALIHIDTQNEWAHKATREDQS